MADKCPYCEAEVQHTTPRWVRFFCETTIDKHGVVQRTHTCKDREIAALTERLEEVQSFDAGLLNDFGGGNVEWWHDYIRSLVGQIQELATLDALPTPDPKES